MKRVLFLSISACLAGLMSCSQEQPEVKLQSHSVSVTASINGMKTRASDAMWDANDAIGIYAKKAGETLTLPAAVENVKYVTTDGTGTFIPADPDAAAYLPNDGSAFDFIAYYPQKELTDLTFPVDVSVQTQQSAIDLLYSANAKNVGSFEQPVNMVFTHQLSKVVLKISSSDTEYSLAGLRVALNNTGTKADFSLSDGTLSAPSSTGNIDFQVAADGATAEAIVLPVSGFTNEQFTFIVGNDVFTFPLKTGTLITSFQPSTRYTYTVTLNPQDATVTLQNLSGSITDWTSGPSEEVVVDKDGTSPTPDPTPDPVPEPNPTPNPKPDPAPEVTPIPSGSGTQTSPYNIAQARSKQGAKDNKNYKWVEGYIVGYKAGMSNNIFGNEEIATDKNIIIAPSPDVADIQQCLVVQLPDGNVRTSLGLKSNPGVYKKRVKIEGSLEAYYSIPGLKYAKTYELVE